MSLEEHEERIRALEGARKEVEESLIVMAHLETRQSNTIRDLAARAAQAEEFEERMKAHWESQRQLNAETDKRIADLVSAIGVA